MSNPTVNTECAAVDVVADMFGGVFSRLQRWRNTIEDFVAVTEPSDLTTRTLDPLIQSLAVPALSERDTVLIGAGFVAAPGILSDSHWHLAWWLGEANTLGYPGDLGELRRLEAVSDPQAEAFRDYTKLEWWRVPERTGEAHITGPYVDYLCTDDYTLTMTMPVFDLVRELADIAHPNATAPSLIGMVGVDIYVKRVESLLLPHLFAVGRTSTLVNSSGRVVVSTDAHLAAGSLVRELSGDRHRAIECPGTTLTLLVDN